MELGGVWLYQTAHRLTAPPPLSPYHHSSLKVKYYSACSKCSTEHTGTHTIHYKSEHTCSSRQELQIYRLQKTTEGIFGFICK